MTSDDEDYVYDEASGEWMSAGDIAVRDAAAAAGPEVRDAVGNLLANALRYSPPDSLVEIGATLSDTGLRIRVADHGPGLDADELDKLGEPYFRGAAALGKKGSGLGYHFTRRIVEAHAGTLTARSGMDVGLEVEVFLPR